MTKPPDDQSLGARLEHLGPASKKSNWLKHRKERLQVRRGKETFEPFDYEWVERKATDAVVLVLYRNGEDGVEVLMRSSLRPPIAFRGHLALPFDPDDNPEIWELPAGLIEENERGEDGLVACAIRETEEETGYRLSEEDFSALGGATFLSPGVIAEQIYPLVACLDERTAGVPSGDGSPVEEGATLLFMTPNKALQMTQDAKSELAIRRFVAAESKQ